MGVTGLETAFAVLYTDLVLPGVLELATLVERLGAGAEPMGFEPARIAAGAEANLTLCDLDAEWEAGAEGWESRSGELLLRRPQARPAGSWSRSPPGRVAYRQRSFALGVA